MPLREAASWERRVHGFPRFQLAQDQEERGGLEAFFTPRNIAVIGATEKAGSVGRTIVWNLISSPFGGTVFPVNPKRPSVLGIKAYPRIADVPDPIDLAIVTTPAATVPDVIGECVEAGVRAAIIISAGFKEIGAEGAELERRILEQARRGRMRIIGPNCLGVMSPLTGLNATFAARHGPAGQGRLPQPERGPLHRDPRLELAGERRLQRLRLDRLDARRRLGRPDRLPRRRPAHQEHHHLHGVDRRRARPSCRRRARWR